MKVLATSDIHGDKKLVERLAEKAKREKADLVVICGDLTEFERDLEGLIGPFKRKEKEVLLIPGNHESLKTVKRLAELYKPGVKNLHGSSFKKKGVGFFGSGLVAPLEKIKPAESLRYGFKKVQDKEKKVMVVHSPPFKTKVDKIRGHHFGSSLVRRAIGVFQPDFCLCGHIHENFGKEDRIGETRVINVGRKGTILEI